MLQAIVLTMLFLLLLSWFVAVGSALELVLWHRADGKSIGYYLPRGAILFKVRNFAPTGGKAHQRMLVGAGGFVVSAALMGAMVVISG